MGKGRALGRERGLGVVTAVSAAVLVLSTFLPWFHVEVDGIRYRFNAWTVDEPVALAVLVAGMLALGIVLAVALGNVAPPRPFERSSTWLVLGVGSAALVGSRAALGIDGTERSYGLGAAAVAALVVAAAGAAAVPARRPPRG